MVQHQRASLYIRLSRAADETNTSLEGMISDVRALVTREGFTEIALHVDDGFTGGYRDREEFQAWLADAREGRCDVLATYHTDRLTREGLNVAASILDVVEGKDPESGRPAHRPVRLIDAKGLDSKDGDAFRFRFVIQAEVGRAERERMRDRSRAKQRRLRQAGRWPGGPAPYGYQTAPNADGPGSILVLAPKEAAALREAADAILGGEPLGRVVRRFNHAGITPRRAAAWTRTTLGQSLTGEAILGRLSVRGKPIRDDEGNILAPFPAIITEAESAAIRAALAVRTKNGPRGGRKPARLLSGILTCVNCGNTLQVGNNGKGVVVYRCQQKNDKGTCTQGVSARAEYVEAEVTARFLAAVGDMPVLKEKVTVSTAGDLAAIEAEIREVMADMATQADAALFTRLQKLQAEREELANAEPNQEIEMIPTGETIAQLWGRSMTDDQRDTLAGMVPHITLQPGQRGRHGFDADRLGWPPEFLRYETKA